MSARRTLVIGHRGAPGYLPEHTASSYRLAIEAGVDALEPDVVATRDGVLVVRHENEIGSTTDVAARPEFAARRTTKTIDGDRVTGWFTEDFTWAELATLRARERMPEIRRASATHDGQEPILRLRDLFTLVREAPRPVGLVIEIKHATYFAAQGFDLGELVRAEIAEAQLDATRHPLVVESFERSVLTRLRAAGVPARTVYLCEARGAAADLVARMGDAAPTYAEQLTPAGLDELAGGVNGISLDKRIVLAPDLRGRPTGPAPVVAAAHERGLDVFAWTARPENRFVVRALRKGADPAAFGEWEREWAILREAELDGVFVDHPDLGVAFFRS